MRIKKRGTLERGARTSRIVVFPRPGHPQRGVLRVGALALPCALGRSGTTWMKREGDGATPAGRYRLLSLRLRPDRVIGRPGKVPAAVMRRNEGWCEDPRSGRYNRPIRLPSADGHEDMWRGDRLYDIVGVLDWNIRPRASRRGSAIFLHLARSGHTPTAGCIALSLHDLERLLAAAGPRPEFLVSAPPRKLRPSQRD